MKRLFIKIVRLFIPNSVWHRWKREYIEKHCSVIPIIKHPCEVFDSVYHIKDTTEEPFVMAGIYKLSPQIETIRYHDAQDILIVPNAEIYAESDIVVTSEGALWDKYYTRNFDMHVVPWDADYIKEADGNLSIYRTQRIEQIKGNCISLLGVFVGVWSHFLMQFVCKLFYAEEAGLLDEMTTLITPENIDPNMEEIISMVVSRHPKLNRIIAENNVIYRCDTMYYIQTTSVFHNQGLVPYHCGCVIPQRVVQLLQKKVVEPFVAKIEDNPTKYEKVFLVRRKGGRLLTNNDEVEEYFRQQGFYFMEGAKYSLQEKAEIFRNAKIIVGPHGTAFANTIFCDKAKCLVFVNVSYMMENAIYNLTYPHVYKWTYVTGKDVTKDYFSDMYVPLDKIKRAYKELLEDEQ